jgi:hypothetical protein
LAELVWPNFSGRPFPEYRRWLTAIGADSDFWSPSLYIGLLPLLLAFSTFTLRGADAHQQWLSWIVLIGLLGSLGSYGLGWLLRQLSPGSMEATMPVADGVGGLYWLLTVVLPGYVQFRFPGKLMVLAAVGLAALAAQGWDHLEKGPIVWLSRGLAALGALSGAGALAVLGLRGVFVDALTAAAADPLFGPFKASGAWLDLCQSFLHTAVLCGSWWWLLRKHCAKAGWSWLRVAVVPLCAADLAIANAWMVLTAPANAWHGGPSLATRLSAAEDGPAPVRFFETPDLGSKAWRESADPQRAAEVVAWQRRALIPNFHLSGRLSSVRAAGTTILFDYEQFMSPAARHENDRVEFLRPRRALDAWGTAYFVLPSEEHAHDSTLSSLGLRQAWLEPQWLADSPQPLPEGGPLPEVTPQAVDGADPASELHVLSNPSRFPRAWIVHQVFPIKPLKSHEMSLVQPLMQAMLFPDRQWIDLRHVAIVEDDVLAEAAGGGLWRMAAEDLEGESCRITRYEPGRVELQAELRDKGLIVLADAFYPGWKLDVESNGRVQHADVLRTNRMMRGVLLPAGHHHLVYRYAPATFRWGATVSVLALLLLTITAVQAARH